MPLAKYPDCVKDPTASKGTANGSHELVTKCYSPLKAKEPNLTEQLGHTHTRCFAKLLTQIFS